jgi:hypothetical protein
LIRPPRDDPRRVLVCLNHSGNANAFFLQRYFGLPEFFPVLASDHGRKNLVRVRFIQAQKRRATWRSRVVLVAHYHSANRLALTRVILRIGRVNASARSVADIEIRPAKSIVLEGLAAGAALGAAHAPNNKAMSAKERALQIIRVFLILRLK